MNIYVNSSPGSAYGSHFNVHFNSEGDYLGTPFVRIYEETAIYNEELQSNVSYWNGDIEFPNGMTNFSTWGPAALRNYGGSMIFPNTCHDLSYAFYNSRFFGDVKLNEGSVNTLSSMFSGADFNTTKALNLKGIGNGNASCVGMFVGTNRVTEFKCPDVYLDNTFSQFTRMFGAYSDSQDQHILSGANIHFEGNFNNLQADSMFQDSKWFNGKVYFNISTVSNNCNVSYMFKNCNAFNKSVTFPDSVGEFAAPYIFQFCNILDSPVTFPKTVDGNCNLLLAFRGCTEFNSVITFPETITGKFYAPNMMDGCIHFDKPVTLPVSQNTYAPQMLQNCFNFNSPVVIPESEGPLYISWFLDRCPNWHSSLYFYGNFNPSTNSYHTAYVLSLRIEYNILTRLCNVMYTSSSDTQDAPVKNGVSLYEAFHGSIYMHDLRVFSPGIENAIAREAIADQGIIKNMGIVFNVRPNPNGNANYLYEQYYPAIIAFHDSIMHYF